MPQVHITKYNEKGEGIALTKEGPLIVPFALVGEMVSVTQTSQSPYVELESVDRKSPQRVTPPCPYFGTCGGCQLQHMAPSAYEAFKINLVRTAFEKFGLDTGLLKTLEHIPDHSRRRINVRIHKERDTVQVGFHKRRSHEVVDIQHCLLLEPTLNQMLAPLKALGTQLLQHGQTMHVFLTIVQEGVDVLVVCDQLTASQKKQIADWAETQPIPRLYVQVGRKDELLLQRETPHINFSEKIGLFPQQGFLQPSQSGEAFMVQWIKDHMPKRHKNICDLFCGLGTFTLPLSDVGMVTGFEGSVQAVQYLHLSVQKNQLAHPVVGHHRDLFLYPLGPQELNAYDVVVMDPPRAGAYQQVRRLSKSNVPTIFLVSCNAHTFARDAAILKDGGYHIKQVALLDQFKWSSHVEILAFFSKKP